MDWALATAPNSRYRNNATNKEIGVRMTALLHAENLDLRVIVMVVRQLSLHQADPIAGLVTPPGKVIEISRKD
jgi:hypothetical protein|tara:strand:- start:955 stop:1173 length:219 start_codon:yes stop_codon:yes gene_type:complete